MAKSDRFDPSQIVSVDVSASGVDGGYALKIPAAGRYTLKAEFVAFAPIMHDVIVDADRVAVHWTLSGVHSAEFLGLMPTRKQVEFDGVDIYTMRDGRMAAHWNVVDMWAFYRQVGGPIHK